MSAEEIQHIVLVVEKKLGLEFTAEEVDGILKHTIRKAALNCKGDDYIPILFENELRDSAMRKAINYMGMKNLLDRSAT